MNITLSNVKNTPSNKKSKIQLKFDRLWTQIKKKQKRNDKLKLEMDELLQVYTETVLPKEKEYEQPLCILLQKLITFYSRKSLTLWQRDELEIWLTDVLNRLGQYNPEKAEFFATKFDHVFAAYKGMTMEELKENEVNFEAELESIMSEMENMAQQEASANAEQDWQDDLFGDNNSQKKNQKKTPFEEFDYDQFSEDAFKKVNSNPRASQLINEKWIRNLFRRTARALHPDKEQDPIKREHKQTLMGELLNARDNQDVMTMMLMYNQHVDDTELALGEDEMKSLCKMLQEQQHQLDEAHWEIIQQSPLHESLHETLYAASQKARDKKIKMHLNNVQDGINHQIEIADYIRNLTRLKEVLVDRHERSENRGW